MWAGTVAAIPSGWALCDGTLGTPDLSDRFIVGENVTPGGSGGTVSPAAALTGHSNHAVTQPNAHAVTQPNAHAVTQPNAHAVTQPNAHAVTQPGAHSNHAVTQPGAHSNHAVTQPGAHAALAGHAHELPFIKATGGTGTLRMLAQSIFGSGTSRAPESVSAAPTAFTTASAVALSENVSGGTPNAHAGTAVDAHSAHAGTAVDAHSAHAGTAVDAHAGTAVDAHAGTAVSAHAGTAVDAHAGTAVDAHSAHPVYRYFKLAFIQKL